MAFNSEAPRVEYTSSAGQDLFTFLFKIYVKTDLVVYQTPTGQEPNDVADILAVDVDYTVAINGDSGGSITLASATTAGDALTLLRELPATRDIEYQTNGDLLAGTLNEDQNYQTYLIADQEAKENRSLTLPKSVQGVSTELPTPEALKLMRWKSTNDGLENVSIGDDSVFVNILNEDSMAALLTVDFLSYETVNIRGYYTQNDGGGGLFNYDSTIDKSTANGGIIIDPDQTLANQGNGTGTGCWVRQYDGIINVKWFGAVGDGTTDDTITLQSAVNMFPSKGGELFIPKGVYKISSEINIKTPVLLNCEGAFDLSSQANTSGELLVTFKWSGAADGYMFVLSESTSTEMIATTTTGNIIFGGGIDGALLHGNDLAGVGIWLASTTRAKINVQVRQFKDTGVIVDGGNGALSVRNEFFVHTVWGISDATKPMNGIHFRRFNSFPSTQNRLESVNGLIYDGDLIVFQDTDNNIAEHIHGVTQSGGAGRAVSLLNGATFPARNNLIIYINGDVFAESDSYGNRILHHNSEGSFIEIQTGATLHYDAIDYVTSDLWETPKYIMHDKLSISSDMIQPDGSVAVRDFVTGNLWSSIKLPEAATGYVGFTVPEVARWNNGKIIGIKFIFSTEGTSGGSMVIQTRISSKANLAGTATPEINENATLEVNGTAHVINKRTFTFTTPLSFSKDDTIICRFDRLPSDASDTNTDDIQLMGCELEYIANGPESAGSGPYDIS